MTTPKVPLMADSDGSLSASGDHFRRGHPGAGAHDSPSRPQPLDAVVLDVLASDSPLQRGERIVYREAAGTAEYRVITARSRRRGDEWICAALLERAPAASASPAEARPQRCVDLGVDGGGEVPGLESLRDFYTALDDPPALHAHPEPVVYATSPNWGAADMEKAAGTALGEPPSAP